jgi:hypothetical protein
MCVCSLESGSNKTQLAGKKDSLRGEKALAKLASKFKKLLANSKFHSHLASWRVVISTPGSRQIFPCYFRAAIQVREDDLHRLMEIVGNFSTQRIQAMKKQVRFLYDTYFQSMAKITLTTLQILNDRIFPYNARSYHDWNDPPYSASFFVLFFVFLLYILRFGVREVCLS